MTEKGYIKLAREMQDHHLWTSESFTRAQAWIDLLFLANWKPTRFYIRGNRIDVARGQLAYAVNTLAERWKWSRTKATRYLNDLEKEQQIVQQKTKLTTLITIVNYDKYQTKNTSEHTADETTERQQKDNRSTTEVQQKNTLEEVKEIKELNKGPDGPSIWDIGESLGLPRSLIGKQIGATSEEKVAEVISQMAIKKPADAKQYFVKATTAPPRYSA